MHDVELLPLGLPIDLNSATAADLDVLPGIGPALAQRIVDYSQKNGLFRTIDDLEKVSGMGQNKLEKLKQHLTISADNHK